MLLHDRAATDAAATVATEAPATDAVLVRAAIARFAPVDRDLLVMRFRDDLPLDDLAAHTGLSPAQVQQRLHRAAWVVEDAVGPMPLGAERAAALGATPRPVELAEQEAALGITPVLAARFVAAVAGETPPAADDRWRWHALLAAVQHHGEGLLTGLVALAVVLPAAASLTA